MGDGKERVDLARLMVGSQGTMCIITKIKFRLIEPLPYASMAILFVNDINELATLIPTVHEP